MSTVHVGWAVKAMTPKEFRKRIKRCEDRRILKNSLPAAVMS